MNDLVFNVRPLQQVFGPVEPAEGEHYVDAIYRELRSKVVDLSLPPDMPLSEKELATVFEASKTPVREALIRLSGDGLVRVVPQSGTFVAPISLDRYLEAVFIRERLETGCVLRLAGTGMSNTEIIKIKALLTRQEEAYKAEDYGLVFSLDDQFHRTLFEFAGLAGVWSVMQSARAEIDRVRQLKTRLGIRRKKEVMAEHWAIVDAIEAKDGARAEEALRHNIGVFDAELGYLSNHPQFLDTLDSFNELVAQQRKGRRSRKLF
jgi:DNA-binding GntR family transcriptional regulator